MPNASVERTGFNSLKRQQFFFTQPLTILKVAPTRKTYINYSFLILFGTFKSLTQRRVRGIRGGTNLPNQSMLRKKIKKIWHDKLKSQL